MHNATVDDFSDIIFSIRDIISTFFIKIPRTPQSAFFTCLYNEIHKLPDKLLIIFKGVL